MTNENVTPLKNNIDNSTNIEEHLKFTENLIHKYDWDLTDKVDFESRLFQIKRKQQDKLLNLSVVGEFGTGKSTLINALLRNDEFLVSSSLQGTTVAATIVENSDEHSILLEYMNEQQEYYTFEDTEKLRSGIISCTTDPEIAQNLYNVRIRIPSTNLGTGFRIIDTPGLNANEKWHEKVTLRTIDEMSDMSVLIIDANKPLTGSFCEFVKQNLGDVLHQCVFLVTRIDMIRKRERQGVLDYLKVKVAKEFELEDPIVLPYSSISVLDEIAGEPSELANLSHDTEEALLLHMRATKELAQKQKLEALIDDMLLSLAEKLRLLSDGYKDELDLLIKSKQIDLAPFIKEQKDQRMQIFENSANQKCGDIIDFLAVFAEKAHESILANIDYMKTSENLRGFINNALPDICAKAANDIVNEGIRESVPIQEKYSSEMIDFHKAFENHFRDYDILKLDICSHLYENLVFPAINTSVLAETGTAIANNLLKETKSHLGSTAAGAAIGSALFLGVGTVIGGVIGFLSGNLFGPNMDKIRQETKEKLSAPLKGYLGDVINHVVKAINMYISDLKNSISTEMNKYLSTYNEAIENRIAAEEEKITLVEAKISEIHQDISDITKRKTMLNPPAPTYLSNE